MPQDVNNDGKVSALDALVVINQLSLKTTIESEEAPLGSQVFADVNGDGKVTAIDALLVINSLEPQSIRQAAGGGIPAAWEADPRSTDLSTEVVDAVFTDLSGDGLGR
jgi:hypothetical protein